MKNHVCNMLVSVILITFFSLSCTSNKVKEGSTDTSSFWEEADSLALEITEPVVMGKEYDLITYGGKGDGISDNKPVFDKLIKLCSDNGGGKIIVTEGVFLIKGPLHLESNITLQLDLNSTLKFSSDPEDYLPVVLTSWEGTRIYNYSPLIYARNQKNISVTGQGEIDGEASETWAKWKKLQDKDKLLSREMNNNDSPLDERVFGEGHFLRPQLIQFYECENIMVDGIKITDSPFWCLHFIFSKNIIIRNVIYDAQNLNNDGIDVESSESVLIENIEFNNHDDNIAIKAGRDREARLLNRPSQNIYIRNCRFEGYNAFAVGSEMSGGVHNVFVRDCVSGGNVIYGIYLKGNLDRGGEVSNIFVKNIEFDATESAILIDSYYKKEGSCCPPVFRDIFIENVRCNSTRDFGISLIGSEKAPLNNIWIKDVNIKNASKEKNISNVENLHLDNVDIQ